MKTVVSIMFAGFILAACQSTDDEGASATSAAAEAPTEKREQAAEQAALRLPSDKCAGLEGFEKMTCVDPELKRMDDELAGLVARLIAHSDHNVQADVRARQATWQREVRNPCMQLGPPKRQQCFAAAYTTRMNEVRDEL